MKNVIAPSVSGIREAAETIDPVFRESPLLETATANMALGHRLLAKVESLNPIRSFKGRGTDWWLANLPESDTPIVSASAGNFGQGLAYAAGKRKRQVIIFAALTANPRKLAAMKRLGAEVRLEGDDFDSAKAAARQFALARNYLFVEDGGSKEIAEGAGTIALEMTQSLAARQTTLDAIVIPLGNGALLTGVGTWIKHVHPQCRVIGVVAAGAPSMKLSWEASRAVETVSVKTCADGIAVRDPVPYALATMIGTVDEVVEVQEADILAAVQFCHTHYGVVVEPAGAAGLAAILGALSFAQAAVVGTVLCGSNVVDS